MTNLTNLILNTDSYTLSHDLQYPPGTRSISAYIEARKGSAREHGMFFGLQMFLLEHLSRPVTLADLHEGEEIATAHGLPFHPQMTLTLSPLVIPATAVHVSA